MTRRLLNFRVAAELENAIERWLKINPNVSFTDLASAAIHEYIHQHHFYLHKPAVKEPDGCSKSLCEAGHSVAAPACQLEAPAKLRYSIECWISAQTHQGLCVLLLNKINKRNRAETFWQPITGGIDRDETPIDACVREVFEETGMFLQRKELKALGQPMDVNLAGENRTIRKHIFFALLDAGRHPVNLSEEHVGFNWTPVALIKDKLAWGGDVERWEIVAANFLSNMMIQQG